MNMLKKALAITVAAITLGGSAMTSTQASAHEWFRGHDFHFSRWYGHDHDDYGYRDRGRYEFRRYDRRDYDRRDYDRRDDGGRGY